MAVKCIETLGSCVNVIKRFSYSLTLGQNKLER
jgi:hypothetical protein